MTKNWAYIEMRERAFTYTVETDFGNYEQELDMCRNTRTHIEIYGRNQFRKYEQELDIYRIQKQELEYKVDTYYRGNEQGFGMC